MRLRPSYSALTALSLVAPAAIGLRAQEASSGILGVVTDTTGAAIPGAKVVARNVATNVQVNRTADGGGRYQFSSLPAGRYVVTMQAEGFSTTTSSPFTIETGQATEINLSLPVGSSDVTVNVSAGATLINTTSNDLGVTIDSRQIENLPVANRNLFDLLALQPGVNADQSGTAGSTGQNARGGFEVNGAPGLSNSILLDGVDATFGETNGAGAGNSNAINTLGIGAIEEFRTTSSTPSAEYGRAAGGVLTITTKSGTNAFHGNVFEYFRNDYLDANAWANNHAGVKRPELRFNEFGANIGGPIWKDRLFFFTNYEGSRIVAGASTNSIVPTARLIARIPNKAIAAEIAHLPLPNNNPASTADTGRYQGNLNTNTIEDTGLVRVDTNLGSHRVLTRLNINNQGQAVQQLRTDNQLVYPLRLYNAEVGDVWTLRGSLVNEFRLGLNRNDLARHNTTFDTSPYGDYIAVTGSFSSDSAQSELHFLTTTYTLVDNLTYVRGKHTFTFGTDNRRLRSARYQDTNNISTYSSITNLVSDMPQQVQITFGTPKYIDSYQLAFYAQDSFKPSPRLTLNYGVRYDRYTPFVGAFNIRDSNPFSPLSNNKRDSYFTEDRYNLAPRVGLIGDVLGNQKLVFRSGFALMFLPPQPFFIYDSSFLDPRLPFNAIITPSDVPAGFNLKFPVTKSLVNAYAANPNTLPASLKLGRQIADFHHTDEYSINWNANLQYQASKDLVLTLTYTALRDLHGTTTTLPNQFAPGSCPTTSTCGPRPNANFGNINHVIYEGRTTYDAMYAQARYRHGQTRADFYYTFATSIQEWAGNNNIGTGQGDVQDLTNPAGSRGPANGSSRNRIVASYTYTNRAPAFAHNPVVRQALGGYSVQGIIRFNTGVAANVLANRDLARNSRQGPDRPDRVLGQSLYSRTVLPDGTPQYLNVAAFDSNTPYNAQRYGNLGYDAIYGPHQVTFNASVIKAVSLFREKELRLRLEAFNVFNHPNYSNPTLTMTDATFGQVLTRRDSRVVQLGAEFRF